MNPRFWSMLAATACAALLLGTALPACGPSDDPSHTGGRPSADSGAKGSPKPVASGERPHRYDHKSGIVTMKSQSGPDADATIFFDDYGNRLSTTTNFHEKFNGKPLTITNVSLFKDSLSVLYDPLKKVGYSLPVPEATMNYFPRFEKLSEEGRKAILAAPIEPRTILGRECLGYALDRNGIALKIWSWDGIPLRTESHFGVNTMLVLEAMRLEVDVPVPAERFEVPAGVKITPRPASAR